MQSPKSFNVLFLCMPESLKPNKSIWAHSWVKLLKCVSVHAIKTISLCVFDFMNSQQLLWWYSILLHNENDSYHKIHARNKPCFIFCVVLQHITGSSKIACRKTILCEVTLPVLFLWNKGGSTKFVVEIVRLAASCVPIRYRY
jgi:hypothetical protein